eukprot:1147627-Pelagomonas_calceolata.AAC.4
MAGAACGVDAVVAGWSVAAAAAAAWPASLPPLSSWSAAAAAAARPASRPPLSSWSAVAAAAAAAAWPASLPPLSSCSLAESSPGPSPWPAPSTCRSRPPAYCQAHNTEHDPCVA